MADLISFAIEKAASELIKLQADLRHELPRLLERMSTVKGFIADAEEQRVHSNEVGKWLEDLQDVVLDAHDLLDEISDDDMRLPELGGEVCAPLSMLYLYRIFLPMNISRKLKEVRVALDEVIENKPLGLTERHDETIVEGHSVLPEGDIIGRMGDKINVKQRLLDSSFESGETVSVISIAGVRGIGKTALAQRVFKDDEVGYHFDLRMWTSVSEVFDLKQVIRIILGSATGEVQSLENSDTEQLRGHLRKHIEGKRYLLVLDDVRNEDWHQLLDVLGGSAKGSRILVTTRTSNPGLAQTSDSRKTYTLKGLSLDHSWTLFKRLAFENEGEPEGKRGEIGRRILDKCGGNPLVIKTVGSILRFKRSEAEWSSFEENQFSRISQTEDSILPLLRLKYDNLPRRLKYCFAYCAVFPEQFEIDVKTLINLWIAQGFIVMSSQSVQEDEDGTANFLETESMEDMGYRYFHNLLSRDFFQAIEKDENGRVTRCNIPYSDLAMSIAGGGCLALKLSEEKIDSKTRHVSFHFHLDAPWQVPTSLDKAKRIRTILLPSQLGRETEGRPGKSICGKIVSSCKFLRVLDLHNSGIKTVSRSIHKLKHLRFLDLSDNMDIRKLPNSITKLHNLQTLKLNFCSGLKRLPRGTRNLVNLRHLEIEGCYSLTNMPLGLGQLTNLCTLSEFVLSKDSSTKRSSGLDELMNLNHLHGQLLIKNLKPGENYGDAKLENKPVLRSLVLIWDVVDAATMKVADCPQGIECSSNEDTTADDYLKSLKGLKPHKNIQDLSLSDYGGLRFPKWFASLENLVRVSLWRCMNCQYLPRLDKFSRLKILVLGQLTSLEYLVDNVENKSSSEAILSSLEELHLIELPKLKGWWREKVEAEDDGTTPKVEKQPSFSHLSKLVIKNCPALISMPLFPRLDELLELNNSSWKPFQQTMMSNTASSPAGAASAADPTTSLWPLSKLRRLRIVGIKEVDMPNGDAFRWSLFRENLCSLTFDHLQQLRALPEGLTDIDSLQELHINRCNNLEVIPDWIRCLKSLKKVSLRVLPSLTSLPEGLNSHTSSIKLEIEDCPKIARNPVPVQDLVKKYLTTSEDYAKANAEEVVLKGSSYAWEQFQQAVIRMSSNPSSRGPTFSVPTVYASFSVPHTRFSITYLRFSLVESLVALWLPSNRSPLSNKDSQTIHEASSKPNFINYNVFRSSSLRLLGIGELQSLPEWLKVLDCLKKLSIWNCPKLKCLSPAIQHFTSLKELDIYKCEELDMVSDDITRWQGLRRLRRITLHELPKLEELPEGLRHLTALRKLYVLDCSRLTTVPEWISDLKFLKEVRIWKCPNLTSLPEGIRSLASLRKLEIADCPVLLNRCQRETGEDWPKIAHVPELYLGYHRSSSLPRR